MLSLFFIIWLLFSPSLFPLNAVLFPFFFACAKQKPNREEESTKVTLRDWGG